MTKFQKIQMCSSVLPVFSSVFVYLVTMVELSRVKAGIGLWVRFLLNVIISAFAVFVLNAWVMTGEHLILNVIATGLILVLSNYYCIKIQSMCNETQSAERKGRIPVMYYAIAAGLVAAVCFIGIMVVVVVLLLPDKNKTPDTNGEENTSLAVITTDEILETTEAYSANFIRYGYSGSSTQIQDEDLEEFDHDKSSFSCKNMSGINTLQATRTMQDTLDLTIDASVEKGNLEIVILIDGDLYERLEANQAHNITLENIAGKTIVVRFAAESADLSVSVVRQIP